MTDYRDRQLELGLEEVLGKETPPDQLQAILNAAANESSSLENDQEQLTNREQSTNWTERANDPDSQNAKVRLAPASQESDRSRPAKSLVTRGSTTKQLKQHNRLGTRWQWAFAGVIVAGLVIAISTLVNQFLLPDNSDPGSTFLGAGTNENWKETTQFVSNRGLVYPQTTDTVFIAGQPLLRDGWVLTEPDAESMLVGLSHLRFHNARAVVRVGRVPDSFEAAEIARTLQDSDLIQSDEELEMLKNSKLWFASMGLAVFVFTGDVTLGDEPIAQESTKPKIELKDVFNRFDSNGNGQIEIEECVCDCSRKCDLDASGEITPAEFAQAVEQMAGSKEKFLHLVMAHGGVDKFYEAAKSGLLTNIQDVSMEAVFSYLDKNESGVLEKAECICKGSQMADANEDGKVTPNELKHVAIQHFGSEEAFLEVVRQAGGVKAFYDQLLKEDHLAQLHHAELHHAKMTLHQVFAQYDRDGSGKLEKAECICKGTQMADADQNGIVTEAELEAVALKMFGSRDKFNAYIHNCGGPEAFYNAVKEGKIGH